MKSKIRLIVIAWTIGILGGLFLWLLRITTLVKIQGYNRRKFDPKGKGLILVHNHPSLWEPALFPFLFFPWYLFSFRFVPFSTPDKINYYDKWWFFLLREVCIPIERGNLKGEARALKGMKERLAKGRVLILAPEGGRTFKGEEFKVLKHGKTEVVKELSEVDLDDGVALRRLKSGVGWLVFNTKAIVLPVWTDGGEKIIPNEATFKLPFPRFWRRSRINIGEPVDLEKLSKQEITEFLEDSILKLGADR